MSFLNTKTPTKPTCKPKYIVPTMPSQKSGVLQYYLTPELEKEFVRLYPKTFNSRMMELFWLSATTLHRFARKLKLKKDMKVIVRKQAALTKLICEKNGYYDSLRGKAPSQASIDATKKMWSEGFHPMKALKKKNPRKYKKVCEARREMRINIINREKRRIAIGLEQTTNLHLPQVIYTKSQLNRRRNAKRRGYILGIKDEFSHDRYPIYWNKETQRSEQFEKNCIADGFVFECLNKTAITRSCVDSIY